MSISSDYKNMALISGMLFVLPRALGLLKNSETLPGKILSSLDKKVESFLGEKQWSNISEIIIKNAWISAAFTYWVFKRRRFSGLQEVQDASTVFLGSSSLIWIGNFFSFARQC